MKIKLILSLLGLSVAGTLAAKTLSPADALERVMISDTRKAKTVGSAPVLQSVTYDRTGTPALYIYTYSGDRGFMLLPADDAVAPLLGYSETNSFRLTDMPENLKSWMAYYTDQIEDARGSEPYVAVQTRAGERAPIQPLLKTTWDQGAPFNTECPYLGNRRCVTGCVATAMAQVMKYWQYPASGKGSVTYRPESFEEDLTMDFSATSFDWENMLDVYGKTYNATQRYAVATLMKACGYSVRMKYSPVESGAYSKDISTALINYFGYDQGLSRRDRADYTSQDAWDEMVYNDLIYSGPVIYSGQSTNGAHCFVCDGYDGNGFFHINWGWGGMSDGYFLLNELTPNEVGTGGHYGGYNLQQSVVTGIMPPVGRLTLDSMGIDNAAEDSGNVKGWGYTYRINDFSNILLSVNLTISGGHISAPLTYTVYEYDPDAKKNGNMVLESKFDEPLNASDGKVTCSTYLRLNNYDVSKLYNLVVSYELKGQRTTIGSLRMAASSGVDDVMIADALPVMRLDGRTLTVSSEDVADVCVYDLGGNAVVRASGTSLDINLSAMAKGVYIATATTSRGAKQTLKLLLR